MGVSQATMRRWRHAVLVSVACCFEAAAATDRPYAAPPSASAPSHASPAHKRRAPGAGKSQPPNKPSSIRLLPSVRRGDGPLDALLAAPPLQARVQDDKDLVDSGTRARETHGLYEGGLDTRLRNAQRNDADATPSFSIGRSTSIDAFTGRPLSARTEVKIELAF